MCSPKICSKKIRKTHGETPVSKTLFNKVDDCRTAVSLKRDFGKVGIFFVNFVKCFRIAVLSN